MKFSGLHFHMVLVIALICVIVYVFYISKDILTIDNEIRTIKGQIDIIARHLKTQDGGVPTTPAISKSKAEFEEPVGAKKEKAHAAQLLQVAELIDGEYHQYVDQEASSDDLEAVRGLIYHMQVTGSPLSQPAVQITEVNEEKKEHSEDNEDSDGEDGNIVDVEINDSIDALKTNTPTTAHAEESKGHSVV